MNEYERIGESIWDTYRSIGAVLTEARRMTRKELKDVATEVHGTTEEPSKIAAGAGYTPKRTKKETRRAEKRGATPLSKEDVAGMSSADLAQNIKPGIRGQAKLVGRAIKQWPKRGYLQNIPKMVRTMKRDPGEFPAAVSFSADQRTEGQPGHKTKARPTAVTGRTRLAVASTTGKEAHGITLPSERYARSAERHKDWVDSGGKARREAQLAAKGKKLRGQDPRNESVLNTYRSIGYLIAEIARVPNPEEPKGNPRVWSDEEREARKKKRAKRKSFDDVVKPPKPPAANQQVPGMFNVAGGVKKFKDWIKRKLSGNSTEDEPKDPPTR